MKNSRNEKSELYDEKDVDDVVNELSALFDSDIDDDGSEEDSYERTISIEFPEEAQIIYDVSHVEISIRDLLTWLADKEEELKDDLIEIRDNFYAGDNLMDDQLYLAPRNFIVTPEERAVAKITRAKGRDAREAERLSLDTQSEAQLEAERSMWLPFLAEKESIEREKLELFQRRQDVLDAKWERFVTEREHWGDDRAVREAFRRAELEEEEQALFRDREVWHERWEELLCRALDARRASDER